jgi:hypothetical protein
MAILIVDFSELLSTGDAILRPHGMRLLTHVPSGIEVETKQVN